MLRIEILRRDRRQLDPILQPLHRLIMSLPDLGFDVGEIVLRGVGQTRSRQADGECCEQSAEKDRAIHVIFID